MDKESLLSENSDVEKEESQRKLEYKYNANWLDRLFFGWVFPVLRYGSDHTLSQDVLEDLSVEEQSQSIYYKWNDYWNEQKRTNTKDPLFQSIKDTFRRQYLYGTICDFLAYQFTIITPIIIYFAAQYLEQQRRIGTSIFFLLMLPFVRFCRSFFDAHGISRLSLVGTQISNSVSIGMVSKAMRYSVLCNKQFKMGQISSLMQVDCFRLSLLPKNFNSIIFIVYSLIFSIIFMAITVGYAFLAGFGVIFIISFINNRISRLVGRYQSQFAKSTDNRMKITTQVFNNIKFVKVNAWQEIFYDKLMMKRGEQIGWLKKRMIAESFSTFSMWLAPKWILAATFGVFVLTGGVLTPQKSFSIMSLFGYIQFYLQYLPNSISITLEAFNSLKRIQKFLLAEEITTSYITHDRFDLPTKDYKSNAIEVENGNFFWDKDKEEDVNQEGNQEVSRIVFKQPTLNLKNVNFQIKKGELVCLIGSIGAGKSSLLYSLLGEMKFKENLGKPKVTVNGTMSLVTQKPWIVNDTVRSNIVFGERFDPVKYKDIIKYACLERDFELFTHGDQTMIGEKGATLSGGQKARISFARSLYSNSDILLLDDLLSAVDVHVGKFMMTQTLMKYIGSKTRILITHALYYLKYADKILIMENGSIVEQGNYQAIKSGKRFKEMYSNMMKQQLQKEDVSDLLELDLVLEDQILMTQQQILEEKMEAQIIKEASQHSKQSKQRSAVNREKLQELRSKRSKILSKVGDNKKVGQSSKRQRLGSRKGQDVIQKIKKPLEQVDALMMSEEVSAHEMGKLYASYAKYNNGYWYIMLVIFIQALWMCSNSYSNIWLQNWTNFSDGSITTHNMEFWIVGYILIGFSYALFSFIRALMLANSSPKMSLHIHESMIRNLLFSSLNDFFDRVPLGRIFNRLSKDLSSVDLSVTGFFANTAVFAFFLGSTIIILCVFAPIYVLLPVILLYFVVCFFLRNFYSKPAKELTKIQGITKSPIVSCFSQILQGVTTIRCYKKQNMFMQSNCQKIDYNKKASLVRKSIQVWFTLRIMLCSFLVVITAAVYVLFYTEPGFAESSKGTLILVSAFAYDELMYMFISNLQNLQSQLISIDRCESFMNLEPEAGYVQYLKNREEIKQKSRERRLMKGDGWPDKGRLDFIDLKCRYRKNLDLVIRGLNVTFTGGHKIGIVGRTGSGKSTIMMCLLRILEADDGKIMLDGRDISQLSLDDLRSKITIILQDPCLFAGTIRENLDPLGEYNDEQLNLALQRTALKETMDSRQGLESQITENGENLSVGERQLISIARSILKPTRIVLVDEATANIDVTTESIIYKAMNEAFKNSTVITVAHRLNTVINSDRILVLEGGLLKEYDNPQELLKNPNSFFTQLYNDSLKENKM